MHINGIAELVQVISAGTNHMWDTPLYTKSSIPITTTSGIHGPTIAEWVIMTSLVASRRYNTLREWQREHSWDESKGGKALFQSVSDNVGKRFGILGYGSIGRQVARLAKGMGMDVVVFTASIRETSESRRDHGYVVPGTGDPDGEVPSAWYYGHDKEDLHHFLNQDLDQLLVSVPLTKATTNMIGKAELDILGKKNAFLINVARGEILVQEDLIEALEIFEKDTTTAPKGNPRGLRGAALDVTTPEPLDKDHPLWDAPNCIITPHMSCISRDYSHRALEVLEANLERRAKGLDLLNEVNRELGYASKASSSARDAAREDASELHDLSELDCA